MAKRSSPRLREYEKKRDFAVTREPPPGPARERPDGDGKPTYMVHKHHATRLHYDVRLEIEGVLASWAVPKGPSYDPAEKRLAVQTEDHPFDYGSFEGRIPDDEYGGGDSLIWDRGTYDTVPPGEATAQRAKGRMLVDFDGEKLKGRWHLIRTKPLRGKAQWLMFKAKDDTARADYDVVAARPESVVSGRRLTRGPETQRAYRASRATPEKLLEKVAPPMLATLVDEPPSDEGAWIYELKYDGFRALGALAGGRVALVSRNDLDLAGRFPDVARALEGVTVAEAVLDGEICALDDGGTPRFQLLQQGRASRFVYYAFDLLWLDGEDVRGRPLEERRELLESVLGNPPEGVEVAGRETPPAAEALARAAKAGHEGLIAKRRGSFYTASRTASRSRDWLKIKAHLAQEVAIIGYLPLKGDSKAVGALLVAVAEGGGLRFAGKIGTGYSAKLRRELAARLDRDRADASPAAGTPRIRDARWVKPKLVAQVAFTEWTSDGKLRHPSFQGLRDDKQPAETAREQPAAAAAPRVVLSSPTRVYYPGDGITKRMVADYYEALSGPLLAALRDRPLALEHWPKGIDGPSYFHQNIDKEGRPWMDTAETLGGGRRATVRHLIASNVDTLTWMAQMAVLTIHMWSARRDTQENPDWVIFDLDPAEGRGIEQTLEPAHTLHGLLEELKLPTVVKTSGKRGLHVLVPIAGGQTHDEVVEFARRVATVIARRLPDVTVERTKAKRDGRLYLDFLQNGFSKTLVAPYSLRGAPGAPVSAPIEWDEVGKRLDPARWSLKTMPARLAKVGDLFAPALRGKARLPKIG